MAWEHDGWASSEHVLVVRQLQVGGGHRWALVSQLEGVTRRQISRLRKIISKINALLKGLILMPSRQWHLAITLGSLALFLRKKQGLTWLDGDL